MRLHSVTLIAVVALFTVPRPAAADCSSGGPVCLPTGQLPFYQPRVESADVDVVAEDPKQWDDDTCFPSTNVFRLRSEWQGAGSDETAVSWNVGTYTGFTPPSPWTSYQRAKENTPGTTAIQVAGEAVGMYLNTRDQPYHTTPLGGGISTGCWHSTEPGPAPFGNADRSLDIDLDFAVARDQTDSMQNCFIPHGLPDGGDAPAPGAASIAYIDLIFRDVTHCSDAGYNYDDKCPSFTLAIGLHDQRNLPPWRVHWDFADAEHNVGLITGAIVGQSNDWVSIRTGSWGDAGFAQGASFTPDGGFQHYALRISPDQFEAMVAEMKTWALDAGNGVPDSGQIKYGAMSANAEDYRLAHYSVIAETWDPTNEPYPYVCYGEPQDPIEAHGELGIAVRGFRLSSVLPHQVEQGNSGRPYGYHGSGTQRLVYLASNNDIRELAVDPYTGRFVHYTLSAASGRGFSVGPPMGYEGGGTSRVVYTGSDGNVYETWLDGGTWTTWKLTGNTPAEDHVVGQPFGYVDPSGHARVVFRTDDDHLHQLKLNGCWHHKDLTADALPFLENDTVPLADGAPTAYVAGYAARVLYRGNDGHLHELYEWGGQWTDFDLSDVPGSGTLSGRPMGFTDGSGESHVVYRGTDNHVHDITTTPTIRYHRDLTTEAGATASEGAPFGFDRGGERHVVYTDIHHRVQELRTDGGTAYVGPLGTTLGAMPSTEWPMGFATGSDHWVVYPATDRQLHLFRSDGGAWVHSEP